MMTNSLKPLFNKLLKVFVVIIILFILSVSFYSCDQITLGRNVFHEDIIFNDYASKDEKIQIDIINEDTLIYKEVDYFNENNISIYQWVYNFNEGIISVNTGISDDNDEPIIYKLVFLDSNRLLFINKNKILYIDD